MRTDNKKGAGIPAELQSLPADQDIIVTTKKRGRPSKAGAPSAYMIKKYGPTGKPASSSTKTKEATKKTIHSVIILDRSGSMEMDNLYRPALEGISLNHRNLGFEIKDNPGLSYVMTYMTFTSGYGKQNDFDYIYKGAAYNDKTSKDLDWTGRQHANGGTPLHDAIYEIGEYLKSKQAPKADQVLINIFTDGEENTSRGPISRRSDAANYIKELQEVYGFTVTFVGKKHDVETMVRSYNVEASNSLVYDGTSRGMSEAMTTNSMSRSSYSKAVLEGQDVSKNFYSKTIKNEH